MTAASVRWLKWIGMLLALALAGGCSAASEARSTTTSVPSGPAATTTSTEPTSSPPAARPAPATPLDDRTGPLRVVALGDSVASGSGCGCDPYPVLVGNILADRTYRETSTDNLAFGGATSQDVLDQLATPSVQKSVAISDLVLIEIGANDFDEDLADDPECLDPLNASCSGPVLGELRTKLGAIVRQVQGLTRNDDAHIVVMGYWNVFRDGDVGRSRGATYVASSAKLTDAVNLLVESIAAQTDTVYADTLAPIKGDGSVDATFALAADGNHPNSRGHELIADAIVSALTREGALAG